MAVYFDKERKTWYCSFYCKDWTGKTKHVTKRGFARKKDAVQYEVDHKNESAELADISLNVLAKTYLEDYKINHKPNSYLSVEARLRLYVLPHFGDMQVGKISPLRIKNWQNWLAQQNLSQSTVKAVNVAFSTLLNFAVKYYNLPANPFARVGTTGKLNKKINFWELDEFLKVDGLIDDLYIKTVANILFWSGMRIGELEAMTVECIDFGKNTMHVKATYSPYTHSINAPKTNASTRTITMPTAVIELIRQYFDSLYVIPEYPFTELSRVAFRYRLAKYAKLAGVHVVTSHDLRHSHASFLIKKGVALTAIAKRLGHSSPNITLSTYAHVYKNDDIEIAEILNKSSQNHLK